VSDDRSAGGAPSPACPPIIDTLLSRDLKVFRTLTASLGKDSYVPLSLESVVPDYPVPSSLFLKTITPGGEVAFLLGCPAGDVFPGEWVEQLRAKGIDRLYFPGAEQFRMLHYLHGHLRQVMRDPSLTPSQKASRVYDVTLLWTRQFFLDRQAQVSSQLLLALECLDYLFQCLEEEPAHQTWLLELCSFDAKLYTHCLNTCLIGLAFTRYLGWPAPAIRDFGLGALLHDLGLIRLVPAMIDTSRPPGETELALLQKHPIVGYNLLKTYSPLNPESLLLVLQHHEQCDGSGYPQGLRQGAIDPVGRLMRIIDGYEALTFGRMRAEPMKPVEALWLMRQEWQQRRIFDAHYLTAFIRFLSF